MIQSLNIALFCLRLAGTIKKVATNIPVDTGRKLNAYSCVFRDTLRAF